MKLTAFLVLLACLQSQGRGFAQTITLTLKNTPLEKVFKEVKKQTGYTFIYTREQLEHTANVSVEVKGASLQQVLDDCFRAQPITYTVEGRFVVIKPKPAPAAPLSADTTAPGTPGAIKATGHIVNEDFEPLVGATIRIRHAGDAKATSITTDEKGDFKLANVENGSYTLEITFIGYEKIVKEIKVSAVSARLFITLKKAVNVLDEVQTTAYSKTSLRFNTGDITTITSKEIERNPVPNVLQALQGRVPGMQVIEQTGQPGGAFQVQIRSLNTLSGGAAAAPIIIPNGGQPLYIVDGVVYPSSSSLPMQNIGGFPQFQEYGNALNYLDPSLIESINILKGADATAIYGSRGAFGVILITTKKAKGGKSSLNVNTRYGFSELGTWPKLMNTQQYLALRHNALANDHTTPSASDYDINGTWDTTQSYDWKKFFLGDHAPTANVNATYTGGSANSNFLVGANYGTVGNIERSKGSKRSGGMNFALNTATNDRKFTMSLSGSYATDVNDMVPVDFEGQYGLAGAPDAPYPFLPNGKLNWASGTNPAAALNLLYNNTTDNLLANTTMNFTPVTGLTFTAAGGFNVLSAKEFTAKPSSFFNPATFTTAQTTSAVNQYRVRTLTAAPRVEYTHTLLGKGYLDVIAGARLEDIVNQTSFIGGSGYATDALLMDPALASSANISTVYRNLPKRNISGFATLNFRWADKYILNLTANRDGSSVFGNNRQFGNFGSVGGGWIISEEPWFKGLRGVIDFLKIKASYGLVGGSAIAPYSYINTFGVSTNTYEGGLMLTPQNLANPYLHWETNKNAEVGLNIDLWKGRINLEAIYYSDHVGDQLTSQPLAGITGFTSFFINSPASIHTYGGEFQLVTKNISHKQFSWTTRINLTIPRTRLMSYPGISNLVSNVNYVVGKPITGIKLYNYAGVDPATGVYNFINAAGVKGEFMPILGPVQLNTTTDRSVFVDLAPKFYGGILNSVNWKNFSMDFLVTVMDRMGPNYLAFQSFSPGFSGYNFPVNLVNRRWMKPGDVTDVPKASAGIAGFLDQNNFINSTGAYSNATYARLQNLSISYHLPARLIQRAHMTGCSVYVAGQNLLTVSKYGDLDPENMQASHMPPLRVYTLGLNLNF